MPRYARSSATGARSLRFRVSDRGYPDAASPQGCLVRGLFLHRARTGEGGFLPSLLHCLRGLRPEGPRAASSPCGTTWPCPLENVTGNMGSDRGRLSHESCDPEPGQRKRGRRIFRIEGRWIIIPASPRPRNPLFAFG
ncbi:MAG: hypothetical protein MZU97_12320 [Bacillus subtilis]|nr:hypothetical protein [Bacillus subtilis]